MPQIFFPVASPLKMADDVSDEICDSWEDMIENGVLDKKLEELKVKSVDLCKSRQGTVNGDQKISPQMKLEDTSRTQYVIAVPQVKILKRPSDAKVGHLPNGDKSPSKQPPKTLEQREAEYAEARLRILGSAKHEETYENPLTIANSEVSVSSDISPVIRQPKGPDGSKGFTQER